MTTPSAEKHYLETSIVRKLLDGGQRYREYLKQHIGSGAYYYSAYIRMEVFSGFICSLIEFYDTLSMPHIRSFEDACQVWNDKFRIRQLKAIAQVERLIERQGVLHDLSPENPKDKPTYLLLAKDLIFRYIARLLTRMTDTGINAHHCGRAAIPCPEVAKNQDAELERFIRAFNNLTECRSRCEIDRFLSNNVALLDKIAAQSAVVRKDNQTKGFRDIAGKIQELQSNLPAMTCRDCAQIGDAVIALEAPRQMTLHHLDNSFNDLCETIGQPHRLHPTPNALFKSQQEAEH